MTETMILVLVSAATGLVFVAIGIPLFLKRVPPNKFYGCRTQATLSDEALWYDVNRIGGRDFIIAGIAIVICALLIWRFESLLSDDAAAILIVASILITIAAAVVHCLKISYSRSRSA